MVARRPASTPASAVANGCRPACFALPADHAQIEVSAPAGMRLFVDALRLQYVGDAPPPPCFGVTAIPVAIAGVQYAAVLEIVDGTPPLAFPVSAVNNGERKGAVWGSGGGWNDATANAYPDDVQINFNGSKTIDRVVVYTLQDNYSSPVEPTDTLTLSAYGVTAFTVEGWNGSGWTVLGSVSNNNLVKRTVTFAPYSTNAIRIRVTQGLAQFPRLVEVEAWSVPEP